MVSVDFRESWVAVDGSDGPREFVESAETASAIVLDACENNQVLARCHHTK